MQGEWRQWMKNHDKMLADQGGGRADGGAAERRNARRSGMAHPIGGSGRGERRSRVSSTAHATAARGADMAARPEESLDPPSWEEFRAHGHRVLDELLD